MQASGPTASGLPCEQQWSPVPVPPQRESHRSVGFLLPSMFGCFARLRRTLHMHGVNDVKEIFHHSHAFQRDALGLRQSICPLQQCRQVELVSAVGDRGDEMGPGLTRWRGQSCSMLAPSCRGRRGREGGESSGRRMLWSGQWLLLLLCCSRCQGNWARNKNKRRVQNHNIQSHNQARNVVFVILLGWE